MRVDATNFEEFFAAAGERERDLRQLDKFIHKEVPELKRSFFNTQTMTGIAYGMYHYKSERSKQEGDWPVVGLTNQKNYISLYICALKDGKYLAEYYGKKLGKVDTGRSCVRFKHWEDLNLAELKKALHQAAAWLKTQTPA